MRNILIALLLVFAFGCQKQYTKPRPEAVQPAEEKITEDVMPSEKVEKEEKAEDITYAEEAEITEKELPAEEKAKKVIEDVYFDYDEYRIREDARPVLNKIASFLEDEQELNLVIEGHCDERGTSEYNLALGERRAKAVKKYLNARGISPSRMIVITYGEERPVCTRSSESCWQKNRRAHFVVVK